LWLTACRVHRARELAGLPQGQAAFRGAPSAVQSAAREALCARHRVLPAVPGDPGQHGRSGNSKLAAPDCYTCRANDPDFGRRARRSGASTAADCVDGQLSQGDRIDAKPACLSHSSATYIRLDLPIRGQSLGQIPCLTWQHKDKQVTRRRRGASIGDLQFREVVRSSGSSRCSTLRARCSRTVAACCRTEEGFSTRRGARNGFGTDTVLNRRGLVGRRGFHVCSSRGRVWSWTCSGPAGGS
jgi:hypothetical protein